jgi:hypothetical protein
LPQLPTRQRQGKKPLVDYSNSYVATSNLYLLVLKQKALNKEVTNKIKELKTKEKEEKKLKRVEGTFTQVE